MSWSGKLNSFLASARSALSGRSSSQRLPAAKKVPDSSVEQLDEGHLRYRESGKTLTVPIRFDAQIMGQPCAQIHLASLRRWDPPNANLELTVAEIDRVNNRLTLFVFEQRGYGLVLQKQ